MISSFHTPKGTIEYADIGGGIPVLYFHGMLSGSDVALFLEQSLVDEGFRLIIPHRPGYLGTSLLKRGCATSVDCAVIAADVLDHLGIERAAVIGTSAGGPPSISFAIRYPQRTAALVLQCAQIHRWDSTEYLPAANQWVAPWLRMPWSRWLACCGYYWMCRIAVGGPKKCLQGWSGKRYPEIQHDEHALRAAEFFISKITGLSGYYNDTTIYMCEDVLSEGTVDCPTLILHDPLDDTVPIRHAEFAASQIPNAQLEKLNLGGHFIWSGKDVAAMKSIRSQFLTENTA